MLNVQYVSLSNCGHVEVSYLTWPNKIAAQKFYMTSYANSDEYLYNQLGRVRQICKKKLE